MNASNSTTKIYLITFNSKGKYFFEEITNLELVEIFVPKDKWRLEPSTGVWYPTS